MASAIGGFTETVEQGVSGLLGQNGDEKALARSLHAVTTGRAFPDHRIAPDVVRAALEEYSVKRHLERLEGVLERATRRA